MSKQHKWKTTKEIEQLYNDKHTLYENKLENTLMIIDFISKKKVLFLEM